MQSKSPTIADVAKQAEVSTATVSRCLNQPDVVKPEVRERISKAINELGYVPSGAARALLHVALIPLVRLCLRLITLFFRKRFSIYSQV